MRASDLSLLDGIRASTRTSLSTVLPDDGFVALLDFPSHMNTGDSMIWAGERAYLADLGLHVRYVSDAARFNEQLMRRLVPEGPVLLHGGGNFGDIWPEPQAFREHIVHTLLDRDIVQLPQTVYFRDKTAAARANEIFARHPKFTLLVRDTESVERVKDTLPDVRFQYCPDMAFGWTPDVLVDRNATVPVILARTDVESHGDQLKRASLDVLSDAQVWDWGLTGRRKLRRSIAVGIGRAGRSTGRLGRSQIYYGALERSYQEKYRLNLACGQELFSHASVIVTDRLHAHVLAVLMGIDHVVGDNSYGKVSSVYRDYSGKFSTSNFASNAAEVREILSRLSARAA